MAHILSSSCPLNVVPISNPLQISLGPGGLIFASNQTGEIYLLRDNEKDGIQDAALLYCNVNALLVYLMNLID